MYAQLGSYTFRNLIGFGSLSKTSSAKFAAHQVIEGKPILQHVGAELDEFRATVGLHSRFCVPEDEIRTLEGLKDSAEVLPFTTGAGEYKGDFVIEGIDQDTLQTDRDGRVIETVISLYLREYVEPDPEGALKRKDIANSFATNPEGIVPLRMATISPSPASSVLLSQRAAVAEANAVISASSVLETNPSKYQQIFKSISSGVDRFKVSIAEVNDKFQQYQNIKQMVQDADGVIQSAINDAEAIKNSAQNGDLGGTIQNGKTFGSSIGNLSRAFGPLKAFSAGRGVLS